MKKKQCYLCGKKLEQSEYCLRLLDHIICSNCEQVIVEMPVSDSQYDVLKEKIKTLLIG